MRRLVIPTIVVLVVGLLLGAGLRQISSQDVVSREYGSYLGAWSGGSFAGGWLPPVIPASATEIVTINDLARNASRGEFHYDPAETDAFLGRLRPRWDPRLLPAKFGSRVGDMTAAGYSPYEYRQGHSVWLFFVNPQEGHVLYEMAPE